jgi:hypothetical protein
VKRRGEERIGEGRREHHNNHDEQIKVEDGLQKYLYS